MALQSANRPLEVWDPSEVFFSQATIRNVFTFGKKDPNEHVPIVPWQQRAPFTRFILSICHENLLIAFDNRRLLSARWQRNGEKRNYHGRARILCRIKSSSEEISEEDRNDVETEFTLVWEAKKPLTDGHIVVTAHATTYGGAVTVRGASQGTAFPPHGRLDPPVYGSLTDAQSSHCDFGWPKCLRVWKSKPVPIEMESFAEVPDSAFFGLNRRRIFPHSRFVEVLHGFPEWFTIERCDFYPETIIAEGTSDDDQADDSSEVHMDICDESLMAREVEWDAVTEVKYVAGYRLATESCDSRSPGRPKKPDFNQ
ncbi:hypothetical protein M427DRAFT_48507 [Gonapodya prolifera JEL478]|uniref:Uncharacterized protein n=1 Tax=Gonapodya prolifera (strain JEL478) TaxID=1344416 RepID=A0A139A0R6_GONPJ|nr:hypothetical protein M427DRAFT_48507 [Gonapodya prolifera JEL478]|eukprot:KXS10218.1 hypothetical protein M427DRAFT_48507 [Gonapodya prolifera JEL478]